MPASVRFHMPFLTNLRQPRPASSSARMVVMISSHSAMTSGSSSFPPAWMLASVWMASFSRPTLASQRGERGRNGRPSTRKKHGTNCMAQAVRKDAGPGMKEQAKPTKYMTRMPTSMASCWMMTMDPRFSAFAISARYTGTCDEVTPTVKPLSTRPAMSCPRLTAETCTAVPISQKMQASMMLSRRPKRSDSGPATAEPATDPAASAEPMAPWMTPEGLSK